MFICPTSVLESSHVVAAFQTSAEKESLYWMVYLEMGLWLSAPRLHCSVTLLSVLFVTRTPPGAPGGPGAKRRIRDESVVKWCGCKVVMRLVTLAPEVHKFNETLHIKIKHARFPPTCSAFYPSRLVSRFVCCQALEIWSVEVSALSWKKMPGVILLSLRECSISMANISKTPRKI